jgi:hypothetical protein
VVRIAYAFARESFVERDSLQHEIQRGESTRIEQASILSTHDREIPADRRAVHENRRRPLREPFNDLRFGQAIFDAKASDEFRSLSNELAILCRWNECGRRVGGQPQFKKWMARYGDRISVTRSVWRRGRPSLFPPNSMPYGGCALPSVP